MISDLDQANQDGEGRQQRKQQELDGITERIQEVKQELVQFDGDFEMKLEQELGLREQLDIAQSRLDALYAKQGRTELFSTKAERDQHLTDEITEAQSALENQTTRIDELASQVATAQTEHDDAQRRKLEVETSLEENKTLVVQKNGEREGLKATMDQLTEQRKVLLREDGKLSHSLSITKEEKVSAERALAGMMDKDMSRGLETVAKLAKSMNLNGVYGPLYSLFEVDSKYKTAVEVTAGNSLFQIVVDTDETVTKILNQMKRDPTKTSGRVTFMPLNRLKTPTVNLPQSDDAIPMLSKLKYDRTYRQAFEQVFGRTIICADLETAAAYTRSHGVSAITLDGDRVDRKGSLTGGYHDVRRSRLDAVKNLKTWEKKLETESARHAEVQAGVLQLEQEISIILGQIQVLESQRKALINDRQPLVAQLGWIQKEEEQALVRVQRLGKAKTDAQREANAIKAKAEAMQQEKKSAFTQRLTGAEVETLKELNTQLTKQQEEYQRVAEERSEVSRGLVVPHDNQLINTPFHRHDRLPIKSVCWKSSSTKTC